MKASDAEAFMSNFMSCETMKDAGRLITALYPQRCRITPIDYARDDSQFLRHEINYTMNRVLPLHGYYSELYCRLNYVACTAMHSTVLYL